MGLKPLEFSDCLLDTPYFRDSIYDHEKELDQTNDAIKSLIKECRNLLKALDTVYNAQLSFCNMLKGFKLRYIGEVDTDDDLEYEDAFPLFADIILRVEEERKRMLYHANMQLIEPLEKFRKEQIGHAKEEKKKFDKETERVCNMMDTHLKISPKKKESILQESDFQLEQELANFRQMSLAYVSKLHEVNEKKKFEFVEIMLAFMYGQSTFFHNGHDVFTDSKVYLTELQYKLQTTRDSFEITRQEAEDLKNKTTKRFNVGELQKASCAREGYLFVYDKKWGVLGTQWVKHYCKYTKENKILSMNSYTQTSGKMNNNTDTLVVTSCTRKATETSDRRFLFEITGQDRNQPILLQSPSEEDRKQWLEVMEGREPIYQESSDMKPDGVTEISDTGVEFFLKCVEAIEARGIDDQGLYRIAGVSSKFNKLLQYGLDQRQLEKLDLLSDNSLWEVKTITSAMKQYFRNLSDPLLTYKLHNDFLAAIKMDTESKKMACLRNLLKQLPERHHTILNKLLSHLKNVAEHSNHNLMQASNLGVILGPTLMRTQEETMAAIMNIKYQSVVIETMIKNYGLLFPEGPPSNMFENITSYADGYICRSGPNTPTTPTASSRINYPNKYKAPNPPNPSNKPMIQPRTSKSGELVKHSASSRGSTSSADSITPPGSLKRHPPLKPKKFTTNFTNETPPPKSPPVATNSDVKFTAGNTSIKRWPVPLNRPQYYNNSNNNRFAEAITPFTSLRSESVGEEKKTREDGRADNGTHRSREGGGPAIIPRKKEWKVRTRYNCIAENDAELSFNIGDIIMNVRNSTEEGWYIGTLNGKTGLIPENYCEKID